MFGRLQELFSSHYKMERFSLTFGALIVCMVGVLGMCIFGHSGSLNEALATEAQVTTEFSMSKSGVSATVDRVYASQDAKRAFVLVKFNDVNQLSTDAENWSVFLTWADTEGNPRGLHGVPSGSVYSFGSSGYLGVLLVNEDGFIPQVLDVVLRCDSDIASSLSAGKNKDDASSEDASFEEYDQGQFFFNPGAYGIEPLPCLNTEEIPDAYTLYLQSVSAYQEAQMRADLDNQLSTLQTDLASVSEYESRLKLDDILVPERPSYMKGDAVVAAADGTLSLKTSNVQTGGFDFDWRSGSIATGYLEKLKDKMDLSGSSDETFFNYMRDSGVKYETSAPSADWTLADGTALSSLNTGGTTTSRYTRLMGDCTTLSSAWASYMSDKETYQTELLKELLILESDTVDAVSSATVHAGCVTDY